MSHAPMSVTIELTVPLLLRDYFGTSPLVKAYLQAQGVWPQGAVQERWRLHPILPSYVVELEVPVPMPPSTEGAHG